MIKIALIVPVLNNFKGFTDLMTTVDRAVYPVIIDNYNDNMGVAPAWNAGLAEAVRCDIDHAIVVNDDVRFEPGVMLKMVSELHNGADLVSPQNVTGVCHPYGLNFWCFAVQPKKFLQRFGFFDENFAPAYYEDDDMAYRMKLKGGVIRTLDDKIFHQVRGSATTTDLYADDLYSKNQRYYVEKWGGMPNEEVYPYPYNERIRDVSYWRKP